MGISIFPTDGYVFCRSPGMWKHVTTLIFEKRKIVCFDLPRFIEIPQVIARITRFVMRCNICLYSLVILPEANAVDYRCLFGNDKIGEIFLTVCSYYPETIFLA